MCTRVKDSHLNIYNNNENYYIIIENYCYIFYICGKIDSLLEGMATQSTVLAWRTPMDSRAWWAIVHGVARSRT